MKKFFMLFVSSFLIVFATCTVSAMEGNTVSITILYDNYVFKEGLKAEWGFSCIIEGTEKTILFDTGRAKGIFYYNIENIKPNLKNVRQVVISHNHADHTGNLFNFLKDNNKVTVYLPASFPKPFIDKIKKANANVVAVDKPVEICKDVFLTGGMSSKIIEEQSLIINTDKGLVVIAGCSHPGIVNIVRKAKEIINKDVYLVFGGFHLLDDSDDNVKIVIKQLKDLSVLKVGPTHCTGDKAIELFKKTYGENYIQMGVGKLLKISGQSK